MEAHAHDLRAEVDDRLMVERIKTDWTAAGLPLPDQALCRFAVKLTRTPGAMERGDVETLRAAGFDDRSVTDAVQVISYFNYINRIADGLGVDREEWMPGREVNGGVDRPLNK